jgi:hypothetical protein
MDNLREEDNYIILNRELWDFFSSRYGGRTIKRFGRSNDGGEP